MTIEEKQKAINALKISVPVMVVTNEEFNDYIQIRNKTIDWLKQEPKTGYWIYENVLYSRCSECGEHAIIANWSKVLSDFCPKCGAKMVEPPESELENPFNDNRFGG